MFINSPKRLKVEESEPNHKEGQKAPLTDAQNQLIEQKRMEAVSRRISKKLSEESWLQLLSPEFEKDYWKLIVNKLVEEKKNRFTIFPPEELIFNAFNLCPFDAVKVVIIGQDPYVGVGQAVGLSFSVADGVAVPPSLENIFKELKTDVSGFEIPNHGNLEAWARQGVLLLNAVLTVRMKTPDSHANIGWENFTNQAVKFINQKKSGVVFVLWGAKAQAKQSMIDTKKHFILKAAHPSPKSADRGFFGCKHFSQTNELLVKQGAEPIDWKLNSIPRTISTTPKRAYT